MTVHTILPCSSLVEGSTITLRTHLHHIKYYFDEYYLPDVGCDISIFPVTTTSQWRTTIFDQDRRHQAYCSRTFVVTQVIAQGQPWSTMTQYSCAHICSLCQVQRGCRFCLWKCDGVYKLYMRINVFSRYSQSYVYCPRVPQVPLESIPKTWEGSLLFVDHMEGSVSPSHKPSLKGHVGPTVWSQVGKYVVVSSGPWTLMCTCTNVISPRQITWRSALHVQWVWERSLYAQLWSTSNIWTNTCKNFAVPCLF